MRMNDLEDITKLRISPLSMELTVDEKLGIIETECSIHVDEKIKDTG